LFNPQKIGGLLIEAALTKKSLFSDI